MNDHFRKLEKMYLGAKINRRIYDTTTIMIADGHAEISLEIVDKYFHALGAIHGSVYFKLLDDAAFFAANSIAEDVFVLTTSFQINFLRPANSGIIRSKGKVSFSSRNLIIAESRLYNDQGKEIGFGTGHFARSKIALTEDIGYKM